MGNVLLKLAVVLGMLPSLQATPMPRNAAKMVANTFGKDQRVRITERRDPYLAVGYLTSVCTGTLVDEQYVLTAAHCAVDPSTKLRRSDLVYFFPGMIEGNGAAVRIVDVWWGTDNPDEDRTHDWAILKLEKKLAGPFPEMREYPVNARVTSVGYSKDIRVGPPPPAGDPDYRPIAMSAHHGCHLRRADAVLLLHDCHSKRGSSGGPLLSPETRQVGGKPVTVWTVAALNVAEYRKGEPDSLERPSYSDEYANLAIPLREPIAKLKEIRGR